MPEMSDRPRRDEETETDFSESVRATGIPQMPPTPDDWLPEVNQWEPEPRKRPEDSPLEVTVTLPTEHWDEAIATLAQIEDEHLEVVWEDPGGQRPPYRPFVRRVQIKGWWTEDPDGIVPGLKRAEAITLWSVQNRVFEANGLNPIPAEEFFPLRDWARWANAAADINQKARGSGQDEP